MSDSVPIVSGSPGATETGGDGGGRASEQGAGKAPRCASCAGGADPDRVLVVAGTCACGNHGPLYSAARREDRRQYDCYTCEVVTPPMTTEEAAAERANGHDLREARP